MYKYEYETVWYNTEGWGPVNGLNYEIRPYRDLIQKRAEQGWRYVGYIPTRQRGTGHTEEIDLIFEKEV